MGIEDGKGGATIIALDSNAGVVALRQALRSGENGDCYGSVLFGVYPITNLTEDMASGQLQGERGPAYHQHEVTQRKLPIPYERRLGYARRKALRIFGSLATRETTDVEFVTV